MNFDYSEQPTSVRRVRSLLAALLTQDDEASFEDACRELVTMVEDADRLNYLAAADWTEIGRLAQLFGRAEDDGEVEPLRLAIDMDRDRCPEPNCDGFGCIANPQAPSPNSDYNYCPIHLLAYGRPAT